MQAAQRLGHDEWEAIMTYVTVNTRTVGIGRSSATSLDPEADSEEMPEEDVEAANSRGLIEL